MNAIAGPQHLARAFDVVEKVLVIDQMAQLQINSPWQQQIIER
ncbi:hypothetical protein [Synechococcus sp. PROS-7-1]|nr:hypothetical protein [Synechococcus sp. PROS-7-1]